MSVTSLRKDLARLEKRFAVKRLFVYPGTGTVHSYIPGEEHTMCGTANVHNYRHYWGKRFGQELDAGPLEKITQLTCQRCVGLF